MKFRIVYIIVMFNVFVSCISSRVERRCNEHTKGLESLNLNSFKELCDYSKIDLDNVNAENILWIIDGAPIQNNLIVSEIDNKRYDILKIDKLGKDKLTHIYVNKNWELAILVTTNACIKK
ncbi:MAG: hypothetical protein KDD26_05850 [Winogradskyella sp.]|nr:hypothetical protein [Winogradskyella sp.]